MPEIHYDAPPTVSRFAKDEHFFRLIAGPVGSGKTTGCLFELFRRALSQAPAPDGIRHTRFAIVRQTLKELKDTVLKDILQWLPGVANYKVSDGTVYITTGDVKSEWMLIPLDNPEDQRRLLSSQFTGAWMSEVIEMNPALISPLAGRCGRYPGANLGGATWSGIIADTNMPSEGSDWYKLMEVDRPEDWGVFIQPGGMEPDAENLEWLTQTPETLKLPVENEVRREQGRSYYRRQLQGRSQDWVNRYIHAKYGNDPSGSAVFRESFKIDFHCVDDLAPVVGHPLLVGQDFGRNPCAVICQLDHKGRLLVLQEIVSEDMGLEIHLPKRLRPALLDDRYVGKPIAIIGDPAGRAKGSIYEETSFDVLRRHGFVGYPAPTNNIEPRLRAVEAYLLARHGDKPAMLIDRGRCPNLVRALAGNYRFAKTRSGALKPLPNKTNPWSDLADALQYACLAAHGGMVGMITMRMSGGVRVNREKRFSSRAWT